MARTGKTSAIVLPPEHWETLRRVALIRALNGQGSRGSVSEVIRDLVEAAMPALSEEIAQHEKGDRK